MLQGWVVVLTSFAYLGLLFAIAYFADPAFTKTPPRVIVWEVPERVLEQPVAASDEEWTAGLGGDNDRNGVGTAR